MAEETTTENHNNNNVSAGTTGIKTTYHHYGKLAARNTNSDPKALGSSLDNIYQTFLIDQELNEEGLRQRVKRLQSEVLQKQNQKVQFQADIHSNTQMADAKDKRIEELEVERIKVKEGDISSSDYLPLAIGGVIVVLLTLYLFVFYSSTGYSAFYGVKQGSLGFINPNVFAEAQNRGGGVIALILLFPVIFLGLGFLIHDSIEHKKYLLIFFLLLFTLLADAVIGYKIAQAIHNNEFNAGLTNSLWEFEMIYSDINFYLILALGFIVYVIWGVLLNYALNKFKEIQPDKAVELRTDNLDRKIADQRQDLMEFTSKVNSLKSQVAVLENEMADKEKDIIGYQNGVIPVNISQLKASIGDFMNGWFAYTNLMFPYEANKRGQEARDIQDSWLSLKIISLEK